jgi:hypothetical protein
MMDAKRSARDAGAARSTAPPSSKRVRSSGKSKPAGPDASGPAPAAAARQAQPPPQHQRRSAAAFDLKTWAGEGADPEVLEWLRAHLARAREPTVYPGGREYTFLGDPMSKVRARPCSVAGGGVCALQASGRDTAHEHTSQPTNHLQPNRPRPHRPQDEVEAHYGPCSKHWPRRAGFLIPAPARDGTAAAPFTMEALRDAERAGRAAARACNDMNEHCSLHVSAPAEGGVFAGC